MSKSLFKTYLGCLGLFSMSTAFAQTFVGDIGVIALDDFKHKKSEITYTLQEGHSSYKLLIPKNMNVENLMTGDHVIIEGDLFSGLKSDQIKVRSITVDKKIKKKQSIIGKRTVINLLVNFIDRKTTNTTSIGAIDTQMYKSTTSVRSVYSKSSYGQVKFARDPDKDGQPAIFTVNLNYNQGSGCDYVQWADDAKAAAIAAGINVNAYQHKMYLLPDDTNCPWSGRAYIGCSASFCDSWIVTGFDNKAVMSHELGHNLGMFHSSTDPNNDNIVDSEYGDVACVMGFGYRRLNAPQRDLMQWFNAKPERIKTVTTNGTFLIDSLDVNTLALKVLRINRVDGLGVYYVSFRTNTAPFGMDSRYSAKVSIHRLPPVTPSNARTLYITSLSLGQSFVDPQNHIRITVNELDSSAALVDVNLDAIEE